ncbi:MAG: TIGR03621 family F420-dependent LLM class oxidoreductase [Acidimicrobiales bacterium]
MTKPFRFGVQARAAASRDEWVELARKAEDLGYSTLTLPDHFDGSMAPAIALQCAADATTNLRLGALVWCNDYRHPVVFAQEMATLDVLSDGRLELGIGAGWMQTDYVAAGMTYDRPGVRIDRMVESVHVLKGLFGDGPFSFEGEHYTITDLDLHPKPIQDKVPFLIGGGGQRMLGIAGQHADIVGVNANLRSGKIDGNTVADGVAERFAEKIQWIKDGAGDRFDDIELNVRAFFVVFTDDRQGTAEAMGQGLGLTAEQALASPLALCGTTTQMAADLVERRETYGFNYIGVGPDEMEAFAPIVAELAGT